MEKGLEGGGARRTERKGSVHGEGSVERNRFAVKIREDELLRAGSQDRTMRERVLGSLKVTFADFALMAALVPLWKPLPRIVRVVPPAAVTVEGEMVPIPRGTAAS